MASPVKFKRGTLANLPSTMEEGDHYVAIDQSPPELHIGPDGGGTPVQISGGGQRPRTVKGKIYCSGDLTTVELRYAAIDDFGDLSVAVGSNNLSLQVTSPSLPNYANADQGKVLFQVSRPSFLVDQSIEVGSNIVDNGTSSPLEIQIYFSADLSTIPEGVYFDIILEDFSQTVENSL